MGDVAANKLDCSAVGLARPRDDGEGTDAPIREFTAEASLDNGESSCAAGRAAVGECEPDGFMFGEAADFLFRLVVVVPQLQARAVGEIAFYIHERRRGQRFRYQ